MAEKVVGGEGEEVQLQQDGARQVEEHFGVGAAAERLRVDPAAQVELAEQAASASGRGQHHRGGGDEAQGQGACGADQRCCQSQSQGMTPV